MLTDNEIIELFKFDKRESLAKLIEKYENNLIYYIYSITNDYFESIDIAQETFIKAYSNEKIFVEDFKIKSWLYKVAYNMSVDFKRKLKKGLLNFFSFDNQKEFKDDYCVYEDHIKKIESEKLYKSIENLPNDLRNVIMLRFFENFSYKEISEIMEIKIGTVMSRLHIAKNRIKEGILSE